MRDIRIDVGVYTELTINLSNVSFEDIEKVIFTIKNRATVKSKAIIEREFTKPAIYSVIITPEDSIQLVEGAMYDFDKVLVSSGLRKKMTDNGNVILRNGVGACV